MPEGLSPKPPGLDTGGGRSKGVRSGNPTGRRAGRVFQPKGEILVQICCRSSDCRSPTQLFVAAGGSLRRRLGVYRAGGSALPSV